MVGRKPGNSPEACWHEGCVLCFGATMFYCFLSIQIIALCWLPGASSWAVLHVVVFERPSEYNQMAIINSLPCSVATSFLQFIARVCKQPGFSFLGWFFEVSFPNEQLVKPKTLVLFANRNLMCYVKNQTFSSSSDEHSVALKNRLVTNQLLSMRVQDFVACIFYDSQKTVGSAE